MALQGTLDTFALPDVLRLLAATKKSGRLHIEGDRGTGDVWVDGGDVVALETSRPAVTPTERLFELLRFTDGDFVFQAGASHPSPEVATPVEPLLTAAETVLAEWRAIETVVPSLTSWVALVAELEAAEVTLDRDRWRTIAAIGAGTTVGELGDRLELTELPVSREVKDLVEAGLVTVEARAEMTSSFDSSWSTDFSSIREREPSLPPRAPAPTSFSAFDEPYEPYERPAASTADESLQPTPARPLVGSHEAGQDIDDFESVFPGLSRTETAGPVAEPVAEPDSDDDDELDAEEVARQLANLSPRAAKAVKAAAQATTDEEREAALADVDDDDEPLNRGLLLKFLSSVKS